MLNYPKLLAPQAYLRVTTVGMNDVDGYVICVILVAISLLALWGAKALLGPGRVGLARARAGAPAAPAHGRHAAAPGRWLSRLLLGAALVPHAGIVVLSFSKVWSFSYLPTRWTLDNYGEILVPHAALRVEHAALRGARGRHRRRAGRGDRVAAAAHARARPRPARHARHGAARGARRGARHRVPPRLPRLERAGPRRAAHRRCGSSSSSPTRCAACPTRCAPPTRRCSSFTCRWRSPRRASGAPPRRTFLRITLPLLARGLVAGGLIAFVTSAVELSSTILLVPRIELGPLSYGIYIYMQSAVGRGAGRRARRGGDRAGRSPAPGWSTASPTAAPARAFRV